MPKKKTDHVTAADIRKVMQALGGRGGAARNKSLTKARKKEIAKSGAKARWAKRGKKVQT